MRGPSPTRLDDCGAGASIHAHVTLTGAPGMLDRVRSVEQSYSVLVYEIRDPGPPVDSSAPTPLIRDLVVTVLSDSRAKVEGVARATAELAWPSMHSGDVPENFGTVVIDQNSS